MLKKLAISSVIFGMIGCAEFAEVESNIIQDKKVRPYTIIVEPAEAAPGDTVKASLILHDAGKTINTDWSIALNYDVDNYGLNYSEKMVYNLDSFAYNYSADRQTVSFVMPKDSLNPLLVGTLAEDIVVRADQIEPEFQAVLDLAGINYSDGVDKSEIITIIEAEDSIPAVFKPFIDDFVVPVILHARITVSGESFDLDIKKRIAVRYSNRLANDTISNVNENPEIQDIKLITVYAGGVEKVDDIAKHKSDTTTLTFYDPDLNNADTIVNVDSLSYFLYIDDSEMADTFLSPSEANRGLAVWEEEVEEINFDWYYTNLISSRADWDKLVRFGESEKPINANIQSLLLPDDKDMNQFLIHVVVRDERLELGVLSSTGTDFKQVKIFLK